ncbi:MAG: hypothetical protein ACFFE5_09225, partial [Candidatus Thorarchaeota archaeon]
EAENKMLINLRKPNDLIIEAKGVPGPVTIIQGNYDEDSLNYAARLTLRYSDLIELQGQVLYGTNYDKLNNEKTVKISTDENLEIYRL